MINIDDQEMNSFFCNLYDAASSIFCSEADFEKAQKEEVYFHAANLNLDYDNMIKNLEFIYGGNVDEQVTLFDNVLEFLREVVRIDNLEALFSEHYYDIEWNMFMEYDFRKGDMKYYRDHFVHQIRNAYLGYVLIWKLDFKNMIRGALDKYPDKMAASFIKTCRKNQDKDEFFDAVLRKTWFISTVFHDIGYPLSHHQRNADKIEQYMPFAHSFTKSQRTPFYELVAVLSSSYLFKTVDYNELQTKYEDNDHGAISALCLLFSYYRSGLIHQLSNVDRCAIELAAYSIFVHTRKYLIHNKDGNSSAIAMHGRPVFVDDPFAFLLRICDDLQEWQRLYFYVNDKTNSLICDKCKMRLRRKDTGDTFIYTCPNGSCSSLERVTAFRYKKISYLCACENISINNDKKVIHVALNYDYIKLLEILDVNREFARFRYNELENLKLLLENQAMFPKIELEYFLSNNPDTVKIKIIDSYLTEKGISFESLKKILMQDIAADDWAKMEKMATKEIANIKAVLGGETTKEYLKNSGNLFKAKEFSEEDLDCLYFYKYLSKPCLKVKDSRK